MPIDPNICDEERAWILDHLFEDPAPSKAPSKRALNLLKVYQLSESARDNFVAQFQNKTSFSAKEARDALSERGESDLKINEHIETLLKELGKS